MLASSLIVKRDKEPVAARRRVIRFVLIIDFSDRDPNRKVQMLAAIVMHTGVWIERLRIARRANEGREAAKVKGVKFGRRPKLAVIMVRRKRTLNQKIRTVALSAQPTFAFGTANDRLEPKATEDCRTTD